MIKTKFTVDVRTSKDGKELNIKYNRKDLVQTEDTNEKLMLVYIESLIRSVVDNGFMPIGRNKEDKDGDKVSE